MTQAAEPARAPRPVILVVDDEPAIRESLFKALTKGGYEVLTAAGGEEALETLRSNRVNLVLSDLKMGKMDGIGLLRAAKALSPEIEVILLTAYRTVETAVTAMREGAYDFLMKPFKWGVVSRAVERALEKQSLVLENQILLEQLAEARGDQSVVGSSPAMRRILELVKQIAPSSATVLIQGESGTGKEVIASAIHYASPRRKRRYVKVSCAALPETLLEAELFGHERGAFTGAVSRKEGRFELANGGTLFLDEIVDMSVGTQVKLLRVLQSGEFERLGGTTTLKVDVRVIAAANTSLREAIQKKQFREDLFYRLNVIPIEIPPLRERVEDIPLLVQHFVRIYSERNVRKVRSVSKEALAALSEYSWPGNVRELENTIERAIVLMRGEDLGVGDLPDTIFQGSSERHEITIPVGMSLDEVEKKVIAETLKHARGDKTTAARLLGVATRTIYRKLDQKGEPAGGGEDAEPGEGAAGE